MILPSGTYGRVASRSGLAVKNGLDVGAGVIDQDFRGEVGVVLFNHTDLTYQVKIGERIAQLVLERISTPQCIESSNISSDTVRGQGGFGSTGTGQAVQTCASKAPIASESTGLSLIHI